MNDLAKILILSGSVIVFTGLMLLLLNKIPGLGRLPGDIVIKRGNFTIYFPIMTSVILSIILSLIFFFAYKR